jgi:hypothetical protein
MKFITKHLLSKWGFEDGDMIANFLEAHGFENYNDYGINSHKLLKKILLKYVIPKIKNKLEGFSTGLETIHNPMRVCYVDGIEVNDIDMAQYAKITLEPEYVDVPDEIVLEEAQKIKEEHDLNVKKELKRLGIKEK